MKQGRAHLCTRLMLLICTFNLSALLGETVPLTCSFTFDPQLSDYASVLIKKCCKQINLQGSITTLQQLLVASVPAITSVSRQRINGSTVHITLQAHKPLAVTSNNNVLTKQGELIHKKFYTSESQATIPQIHLISHNRYTTAQCAHWLLTASLEFFTKYQVYWKTKNHIVLITKKEPTTTILCSTDTLPTGAYAVQCAQLLTQEKGWLHKNQLRICDIRFSKQIIIRTMMLGGA